MRCRAVVVLLCALLGTARADVITGEVISTTSRWTEDRSRIVTEATVRTPDGDVVVSQLGGSVDGIGMKVFGGPELLQVGMKVSVDATRRHDLRRVEHLAVDRVRLLDESFPGFVRTGPSAGGNYLYWASGCVFLTPDAAGTNQVNADNEFEAIAAAVTEWNNRGAGCSYMNLVLEEPVAAEVGADGKNLIKFRDVTWCRPATKDDPPRCHDVDAAGITTAAFVDKPGNERDGEIVDADIELNGATFSLAFEGQTTGLDPCTSEITNTLTHELGHLLGIEHTCRVPDDPPRVDHRGQDVPLCGDTSDPAITQATMYNFQDCGETTKATLEDDDVAAICGLYPIAADPGTCEVPKSLRQGCCSASAAPQPSTWLLVLGIGVFLGLPRKKSHRA